MAVGAACLKEDPSTTSGSSPPEARWSLTGIKAGTHLHHYLLSVMSHQTFRLDVRKESRDGAEPCSRIMEQANRLKVGETLQLITPFEPTPLYEVLGREGFTHVSGALEGGDWEVRFTRHARAPSNPAPPRILPGQGNTDEIIEIDVRGLEPPQPMVGILDALAALPAGARLRARTDREPVLLFEQLEARGFHGEGSEDPRGGYVTLIRHR